MLRDDREHAHYHGVDRASEHVSVDEALDRFLDQVVPVSTSELIPVNKAQKRILFHDVKSNFDIPRMSRSTRDGFALNISEQRAESGTTFEIKGDVRIGVLPKVALKKGESTSIATGSYIPKGANAVVMKEYANVKGKKVQIIRPIKLYENILHAGEDIKKGQTVLKRGTRIGPHHIALLSMLGYSNVRVFRKAKVAFFSTGDELVDVGRSSSKIAVFDAIRPFISSMISDLGAEPIDLGIAKDKFELIRSKFVQGVKYDALILSAGSSVGERDFVARAAESIRGLKVIVHGIAMRPSSPTGLAAYKGRPVILLPGFPTSAIVSFIVFGTAAILKASGSLGLELPKVKARLVESIEGRSGVAQYLRVQVQKSEDREYIAKIIRPTEAQYSSWLQSANGLAVISPDLDVVNPGEQIDVILFGNL